MSRTLMRFLTGGGVLIYAARVEADPTAERGFGFHQERCAHDETDEDEFEKRRKLLEK